MLLIMSEPALRGRDRSEMVSHLWCPNLGEEHKGAGDVREW